MHLELHRMETEAVNSLEVALNKRCILLWTKQWVHVEIKVLITVVLAIRILSSTMPLLFLKLKHVHTLKLQVVKEQMTFAQFSTLVASLKTLLILWEWASRVTPKLRVVNNALLIMITASNNVKHLFLHLRTRPNSKSSVDRWMLLPLTAEMLRTSLTTQNWLRWPLEWWQALAKSERIRCMNQAKIQLRLIKCALTAILV